MPNKIDMAATINIDGTEVNAIHLDCTISAAGAVGNFHASTSIKALKKAGIDILQKQQSDALLKVDLYVQPPGGSKTLIFGGILDTVDPVFEEDLIDLMGRDAGAPLVDETLLLAKDQYFNQPISKIVEQIAQQYGLTPQITDTATLAGISYTGDSQDEFAFSDAPRPAWRTLKILAQKVGYIVYVTPKRELVFCPPGQSGFSGSFDYTWAQKPQPGGGQNSSKGILSLRPSSQARRSRNFTVNVYSYDHNTKQQTMGSKMMGDGSGPTYTKHPAGLTADGAQKYAEAVATGIAKHELVYQITVDGDPDLIVGAPVTIKEANAGDLIGFANQKLFINHLNHTYDGPIHGSTRAEGFKSHMTLVKDIPDEGE